ncbi:MAG: amino acid permease [Gammaproteobacteria bacterium]|nr:MAG: amino acid permease [Gammaproteobacteria bacterium]
MTVDRQLGFWMATALVIGNIIGIGIFVQPASLAPYGLNALLAWAVTAAGCVALAWALALLARQMPQADGPFSYISATLGEVWAAAALWCYWIAVWVGTATIAVGVAGYFASVLPVFAEVPPAVLAASLLWLFTAINLLGIRSGGWVQLVTSALKLAPLALVLGFGLWTLLTEPAAYTQSLPATPLSLSATMAASTIALFAMLGIESAVVPASRVRDPARTLPRATMAGTLLAALVYVAVTAVALLLVPQSGLAESAAPFVTVLDHFMGVGNGRWLGLLILVSGMGAVNGWTLLAGELTRTLADHRLLPAVFGRSNRFGAPANALLLAGLLGTALALMNYSRSFVDGFTFLTVVATAANLPLYLCCVLGLLVLVRRSPGSLPRFTGVIGTFGVAYTVFTFAGVGLEPFLWALALVLMGIPIYLLRRWRGRAAAQPVLKA